MKKLILQILKEQIESDKAFTKSEVLLLKYLNKHKKEITKKSDRIEFIKGLLKKMGMNPEMYLYYNMVFELNYRKDGSYENITKEEFNDPKENHPYKTANTNAAQYVVSKIPFKGSNLDGRWDKDMDGVKYYIVTSYGWYPVLLFKEGVWYEIIERYSSSTGKQISQAAPYRYNYSLKKNVVLVTKDEIQKLRHQGGLDDIMKMKKEKLLSKKSEYISDRAKNVRVGYRTADDYGRGHFKVRFKVTNIDEEDGKIIISVLVQDGGKVDGGKMVPSNGGYLRGEVENWNKERVEKELKGEILSKLREYIGSDYQLTENLSIEFKFTHQYEK